MVVDFDGRILAQADPGPGEKIVVAEIDLDALRAARQQRLGHNPMATSAARHIGRHPRVSAGGFVGAKTRKGIVPSRKTNRPFDGSFRAACLTWIVIHRPEFPDQIPSERTTHVPACQNHSRSRRPSRRNASASTSKRWLPWTNLCARRELTLELARAVALTPSDRVLDVGCGLGAGVPMLGVDLWMFRWSVIDLTADYVETAGHLAAHFGLNHRVRYECATHWRCLSGKRSSMWFGPSTRR